ncbi:MAG: hypothetical protein KME27_08130 [Lyngbya sp. HA4199-MV5]|jgi:hypothetical protein|nr:hypothetical protein [Lyngbya sp. HA4199-MV5]
MLKVTIKSANTDAKLEFSEVGNEYFTVTFSSVSLSASHRVWGYTGDCERLVSLFVEMAENWTGWEGIKNWDAIEDDFSLSCTSDKLGHITLEVELVGRDTPELWSAKFNVEVEAGQLEKIANEMKALFSRC